MRYTCAVECALRLTRRYDASPQEVWAALTDAASVEAWLAPAAATWLRGLREVEPGRVLELDWRHGDEEPSAIRVELIPTEGGTTLVLDHRRIAAPIGMRYIGRWTRALDRVQGAL
jgi:uncharacterized protein YndB with AHSA1/START domain